MTNLEMRAAWHEIIAKDELFKAYVRELVRKSVEEIMENEIHLHVIEESEMGLQDGSIN